MLDARQRIKTREFYYNLAPLELLRETTDADLLL
jgi:hypothetical protein